MLRKGPLCSTVPLHVTEQGGLTGQDTRVVGAHGGARGPQLTTPETVDRTWLLVTLVCCVESCILDQENPTVTE